MSDKRCKGPKLTDRQLEKMIDFLEKNRHLITNDIYKTKVTNQLRMEKWTELSGMLNKLGPKKSTFAWKKCWSDVRAGVKKAYTKIVGGSSKDVSEATEFLCESKKRIAALLGPAYIVGSMRVKLPVSFSDESTNAVIVSVENKPSDPNSSDIIETEDCVASDGIEFLDLDCDSGDAEVPVNGETEQQQQQQQASLDSTSGTQSDISSKINCGPVKLVSRKRKRVSSDDSSSSSADEQRCRRSHEGKEALKIMKLQTKMHAEVGQMMASAVGTLSAAVQSMTAVVAANTQMMGSILKMLANNKGGGNLS